MGGASSRRVPTTDLQDRTGRFALAVLAFCRLLPDTPEAREAASQLRRAANSVRSNYRAARRGRSHAEFRAKLGVVYEEADECVGWLQYLAEGGIGQNAALLQEARELTLIFARAVRTARATALGKRRTNGGTDDR